RWPHPRPRARRKVTARRPAPAPRRGGATRPAYTAIPRVTRNEPARAIRAAPLAPGGPRRAGAPAASGPGEAARAGRARRRGRAGRAPASGGVAWLGAGVLRARGWFNFEPSHPDPDSTLPLASTGRRTLNRRRPAAALTHRRERDHGRAHAHRHLRLHLVRRGQPVHPR